MRSLTKSEKTFIHALLTSKPKVAFPRCIISREAPKRREILKWPHYSDALGVSPDGIPQAREEMRRRGIALDFDAHGRAIITGPAQMAAIGKAVGLKTGRDGWEGIRSGRESARGQAELRRLVQQECDDVGAFQHGDEYM